MSHEDCPNIEILGGIVLGANLDEVRQNALDQGAPEDAPVIILGRHVTPEGPQIRGVWEKDGGIIDLFAARAPELPEPRGQLLHLPQQG